MKRPVVNLAELQKKQRGATATEYAIMLVLIILVSIATVAVLGYQIEKSFDKFVVELQSHTT